MPSRHHRLLLVALALASTACRDAVLPSAVPLPNAAVAISGAAVVVTSAADPGDGSCDEAECTLREAIAAVDPGGTITFAVGGTITLAAGQLHVTKPMTITGPGAGDLAVSGAAATRVLLLQDAGEVHVTDLTLAHGLVDGPGGCVQSEHTTLTLARVVVHGCFSNGAGGAIGNSGNGLGFGHLRVEHSTVRDSRAANGGGGIYNNHNATLDVVASTISNNEGREGGGVGSTGYVTIATSTVSGNRARFHGGGVYAADRDVDGMAVLFSTIVGNTSDADANGDGDGGGIFNSQGSFTLTGTIVANNVDRGGQAPDCGAFLPKVATGGFNLVEDPTGCAAYGATAAVLGQDPMLGALADNGGPTLTHAPLDGSPVIDAGGATCPAVDQRGVARPVGSACDIGAVEYPRLTVSIDVRPGSGTNPVNLRLGGTLPVAILSSATFDATTVDVSTVTIGGVGVATRSNGSYQSSVADVNGDGRLDLVVHFSVSALALQPGTTSVTLLAELADGTLVQGTDAVLIVP